MRQLGAAIDAAEPFPSLAQEVEAARAVLASCLRRVQAAERLDATIESVRRQVAALAAADCERLAEAAAAAELAEKQQQAGSGGGGGGAAAAAGSGPQWEALARQLEGATEEAREANVSVNRAKRLLKELQVGGARGAAGGCRGCRRLQEAGAGVCGKLGRQRPLPAQLPACWNLPAPLLETPAQRPACCCAPRPQAQAAALEACCQLDATLGKRPCGSAALRNALTRAEAASAALAGIPDTAPLSDAFGARLQVRWAAGRRGCRAVRMSLHAACSALGAASPSDCLWAPCCRQS